MGRVSLETVAVVVKVMMVLVMILLLLLAQQVVPGRRSRCLWWTRLQM